MVRDIDFEKCGDIIIAPRAGVFALTCSFCHDVFTNLEEFQGHIVDEHDVYLGLKESDSEDENTDDMEMFDNSEEKDKVAKSIECKETQKDANEKLQPDSNTVKILSIEKLPDLNMTSVQTIKKIDDSKETPNIVEGRSIEDNADAENHMPKKQNIESDTDDLLEDKDVGSVNSANTCKDSEAMEIGEMSDAMIETNDTVLKISEEPTLEIISENTESTIPVETVAAEIENCSTNGLQNIVESKAETSTNEQMSMDSNLEKNLSEDDVGKSVTIAKETREDHKENSKKNDEENLVTGPNESENENSAGSDNLQPIAAYDDSPTEKESNTLDIESPNNSIEKNVNNSDMDIDVELSANNSNIVIPNLDNSLTNRDDDSISKPTKENKDAFVDGTDTKEIEKNQPVNDDNVDAIKDSLVHIPNTDDSEIIVEGSNDSMQQNEDLESEDVDPECNDNVDAIKDLLVYIPSDVDSDIIEKASKDTMLNNKDSESDSEIDTMNGDLVKLASNDHLESVSNIEERKDALDQSTKKVDSESESDVESDDSKETIKSKAIMENTKGTMEKDTMNDTDSNSEHSHHQEHEETSSKKTREVDDKAQNELKLVSTEESKSLTSDNLEKHDDIMRTQAASSDSVQKSPSVQSESRTKSKRLSKFFEEIMCDDLDFEMDDDLEILEKLAMREEPEHKSDTESDCEKQESKDEDTKVKEESLDEMQSTFLKKSENISECDNKLNVCQQIEDDDQDYKDKKPKILKKEISASESATNLDIKFDVKTQPKDLYAKVNEEAENLVQTNTVIASSPQQKPNPFMTVKSTPIRKRKMSVDEVLHNKKNKQNDDSESEDNYAEISIQQQRKPLTPLLSSQSAKRITIPKTFTVRRKSCAPNLFFGGAKNANTVTTITTLSNLKEEEAAETKNATTKKAKRGPKPKISRLSQANSTSKFPVVRIKRLKSEVVTEINNIQQKAKFAGTPTRKCESRTKTGRVVENDESVIDEILAQVSNENISTEEANMEIFGTQNTSSNESENLVKFTDEYDAELLEKVGLSLIINVEQDASKLNENLISEYSRNLEESGLFKNFACIDPTAISEAFHKLTENINKILPENENLKVFEVARLANLTSNWCSKRLSEPKNVSDVTLIVNYFPFFRANSRRPMFCEYCLMLFIGETKLIAHRRKHFATTCPYCQRGFKRAGYREIHVVKCAQRKK